MVPSVRKSWVVFFLFDRSLLTLGLILQSEFIISSKNWQIGSIGVWGWPSYRQMERGVAWSTQAWNPSLYIISSAHTRARCHAACDDARVCIRPDAVKTQLCCIDCRLCQGSRKMAVKEGPRGGQRAGSAAFLRSSFSSAHILALLYVV